MSNSESATVADVPPDSTDLSEYDRQHLVTYLRLLDAAAEGADWREVAAVVLGLDATDDPERVRLVHDAHLARARWMTEHGYAELLRA